MSEKGFGFTPEIRETCRKLLEERQKREVKDPGIKSILVLNERTGADGVRITVGEKLDYRFRRRPGEFVLAIFQSTMYLVVTKFDESKRIEPYPYGRYQVISCELEQCAV